MKLRLSVLAALAAFIGCSGDGADKTPPTATSSSSAPASVTAPAGARSPTPPPGSNCPVAQNVCTFATETARGVLANNLDSLVALAQLREFNCPGGTPQGLGGPFPLCDGAPAGEKRQGFTVAFLSSEGSIVNAAGLRNAISRWVQTGSSGTIADAYGPGENRLFSVGCVAGVVPCGSQFVLVFSQRQAAIPTRIELLLYFERAQAGAQPKLTFVAVGPLLRPEEEQAALKGGRFQAFLVPQGWPPVQTFYPLP